LHLLDSFGDLALGGPRGGELPLQFVEAAEQRQELLLEVGELLLLLGEIPFLPGQLILLLDDCRFERLYLDPLLLNQKRELLDRGRRDVLHGHTRLLFRFCRGGLGLGGCRFGLGGSLRWRRVGAGNLHPGRDGNAQEETDEQRTWEPFERSEHGSVTSFWREDISRTSPPPPSGPSCPSFRGWD